MSYMHCDPLEFPGKRASRRALTGFQAIGCAYLTIMAAVAGAQAVLHGGPEKIRGVAIEAPLPSYPAALMSSDKQGLVVFEVTIDATGEVKELRLVETFADEATAAVRAALKQWRFSPLSADKSPTGRTVRGATRIGQLLFRFELRDGKPVVIDVAAESIKTPRR